MGSCHAADFSANPQDVNVPDHPLHPPGVPINSCIAGYAAFTHRSTALTVASRQHPATLALKRDSRGSYGHQHVVPLLLRRPPSFDRFSGPKEAVIFDRKLQS